VVGEAFGLSHFVCPFELPLSQQHLDVFVELGRIECLGERVARIVVGRQVLCIPHTPFFCRSLVFVHGAYCNVFCPGVEILELLDLCGVLKCRIGALAFGCV
jgi:hypothetical protein